MAIIEVQVTQNESLNTTDIFIGERLGEPFYRFHAARLTRLRDEDTFTIGLPSLVTNADLPGLREYAAFVQQVLQTAEQFDREIKGGA